MEIQVEFTAILLATIVSMAIGFAWYSPNFLGKHWMRHARVDPFKAGKAAMLRAIGIRFATTFLCATVFGYFMAIVGTMDYHSATVLALWAFIGLQVPVLADATTWEGKSWQYFLINAGYQLVSLLAITIVLVWWQM